MSQMASDHRDEKIAEIKIEDPFIDCDCMDVRTRKILLYLVGNELKKLKKFPKAWVEGSTLDLNRVKETLELCDFPRKSGKKGEKVKSKRAPSAYNLFMGDCARSVEKGGSGLTFKECAELWNDLKEGRI